MAIRIIMVALALVFGAGPTLVPVATPMAHAQSVSCEGDWCSGRDPMETNCAADARTVASQGVYGTYGATYVELRWSPTCKTNWARANFVTTSIKSVQSTTYTQGYSSNNGAVSWSKMIYSPTHCVKAVIWGPWGVTETSCV